LSSDALPEHRLRPLPAADKARTYIDLSAVVAIRAIIATRYTETDPPVIETA